MLLFGKIAVTPSATSLYSQWANELSSMFQKLSVSDAPIRAFKAVTKRF
jgi:hypothetical protein